MILYLSSQKFGKETTFLKEWIKKHNKKILLIFNALDAKGKEKIDNNINEDKSLLEEIGFEVTIIDLKEYFDRASDLIKICQNYSAFCVMGGNVFVLRQAMKYSGFDTFLKDISNRKEYLYIGYSAGSCVLAKELSLLKNVDEPIDFYNRGEIIYDGIGLIDYIFIPHYKSDYHKAHLIEKCVETCKRDKNKYKALTDGEVLIEDFGRRNNGIIEDIIERNLKRIEKDLTEIEDIQSIDFIDLFPISEEHRIQLDEEAALIGRIVKETERGNVYLLNNPIKTRYGELSLIKVRFFDETRTNWEAAADFDVKDRKALEDKVEKDSRFKYIARPDWDAVEFKTEDTLVYFLKPLASEVYLKNWKEK